MGSRFVSTGKNDRSPGESTRTHGTGTPERRGGRRWQRGLRYQSAVRQKAGRIIAAGNTKEVTFEPVHGTVNDAIDDVYRTKYRGSPYLEAMMGARARSSTIRIVPRDLDR